MKKQRGYVEALLYLAAIAAVAFAVWGAIAWHAGVHYDRGVAETTVKYQERDRKAQDAANTRIRELEDEYRTRENKRAAELVAVSGKYQLEKKRDNEKIAALERKLNDGSLKLYDPGARSAGKGNRSEAAEAGTCTGGRDAEAGAQLSTESARFLLHLTGEADDVVRQLQACQAVVESDRK